MDRIKHLCKKYMVPFAVQPNPKLSDKGIKQAYLFIAYSVDGVSLSPISRTSNPIV